MSPARYFGGLGSTQLVFHPTDCVARPLVWQSVRMHIHTLTEHGSSTTSDLRRLQGCAIEPRGLFWPLSLPSNSCSSTGLNLSV